MPVAPRCVPRLLAALPLAALLLAMVPCAAAQADAARGGAPHDPSAADAPLPGPGTKLERPAIVNGESITAEDVESYARMLGAERQELSPAQARQLARRSVAEEILLAAELARLGVELDDRSVDEYWDRRRGSVPDYAALAAQAGTSVERQRTLARRAAQAELYLLHRVGLRTDFARLIPPDPLMVRLVTVTPAQLRAAFASNRSLFDVPDTVACEVYTCPDEATARQVLEALVPGGPPAPVAPLERSYPVTALRERFPEDVARFLAEAASGSARTLTAPEGTLVVQVTGRQSGRPASFAESQEPLRRMLQNELLGEARRNLVVDLAQHATFWPTDLFAAEPSAAPPPPATPVRAPDGAPAPGSAPAPGDAPAPGSAPTPAGDLPEGGAPP